MPTASCLFANGSLASCQLPVAIAIASSCPATPPTTPPLLPSPTRLGPTANNTRRAWSFPSRLVIIRGTTFLPFQTGLLLASLRKIPLARGKTHHNSSLLPRCYHRYCLRCYYLPTTVPLLLRLPYLPCPYRSVKAALTLHKAVIADSFPTPFSTKPKSSRKSDYLS